MKTIYLNSTKCLGILLLFITCALVASAYEQYDYVERNGMLFEMVYDNETGEGEARLLTTIPEQHIQYEGEWGCDSMLYFPSMIYGEFYGFPLTTIMDGALAGCTDLKEVHIPSSVTRIGDYAVEQSSLESIYFDYDYSPISIGEGAFKRCQRLNTFRIDRPLNQVSHYMFMSCPNLRDVSFNDENEPLDTIGVCAFANCTGLRYLYLPNSVKVIRKGAFANCYGLQQLQIPDGVTTIEDYAFAECHDLSNLSLYSNLRTIGEGAFLNCNSLTSINIPSAITEIKDFTFYGCSAITRLNINNVTTFGKFSFAGCNGISKIDLSKASDIGEGAFTCGRMYCAIWNDTYLNDSTQLHICIRDEAYDYNLGSLKTIILGDGVTAINNLTFAGHIPDTITCMAPAVPVYTRTDNYDLVFCNDAYNTSVLRVPLVLVESYRNAYGWKRFAHIEGVSILGNGDCNGDGTVGISDLTDLIDSVLNSSNESINPINADIDGDGKLTITDITLLIDQILAGN